MQTRLLPETAKHLWLINFLILIKKQLNSLKVEWAEMRSDGGFRRFETFLDHLKILHKKLTENIDNKLESAFKKIFR